MKRILSLLAFAILFNSCDDGNLTLETINFEDITTQSCSANEILYKLKDREALLLQIPLSSFKNEPTTSGSPTSINIDNSTYRVVYRFYNGTISSNNICSIIPPATPYVNDQWTVSAGTIQITTTADISTNTSNNSTRINGYNHNIIFKNITFDKNNGTQVYDSFTFGLYKTTITALPFGFEKELKQCTTSKQVYDFKGSEAFTLDNLEASLIVNEETPLNTPRTALIGSVKNKVTYRLYSGIITPNYFCATTTPTTPTISQEWNALDGVAGVSGIIEVTTIKNGTSAYKHTIVLKNTTLKKGNNDFRLGDNYIYGELTTTN